MRKKVKEILWVSLIAFSVCVVALILVNSFFDDTTSHNTSGAVTNMITTAEGEEFFRIEQIIRKSAHLAEFGLLGTIVFGLTFFCKKKYQRSFFGFSFFFVLLVAVLDEYIQSFSNRTSSVKDVVLDFVGAVVGFAIVCIARWIVSVFKNKNKVT